MVYHYHALQLRLRKAKIEKHLEWYQQYNVKEYADYLFAQTFGYRINWKNPRDLNEWINYFAFCTDTTEWTRLADKYLVREFVNERGLNDILVPLLERWDKAEEIDFSLLPRQFVLKSNHGSGDVIVVKNKKSIDQNLIREKKSNSLKSKFVYYLPNHII